MTLRAWSRRASRSARYAESSSIASLRRRDLTRVSRSPEPPAALSELSEREREVLLLVAEGLSNIEVARRIFAAESTVKTHVGQILRKLGLRDRLQIVVFAHKHHLVDSAEG